MLQNGYIDLFEICDAFIILTRQGVVLTSNDAKITLEEDSYLYDLCHKLIERKKKYEQFEK